jgi:hypothetical protein
MMVRRLRRGVGGTLLIGLIGLAGPMSARAALELWTLVGLPLTATAGQLTTFTLTATNALVLNDIGCLEVDLPPSFQEISVAITQTPEGRPWKHRETGTNVVVFSDGGGGRLELLQSVTFTITARPTVPGVSSWPNHAHERHDCQGADLPGVALPVTVVPQLPPTPTATVPAIPTPTVAPPLPTISAQPTPLPTLSLPPLPGLVTTPRPSASAAPNGQAPSPTATAVQPSASAKPASPAAMPPTPSSSGRDTTAAPAASLGVTRPSDEPAAVARVRPSSTPDPGPRVVFDPADVGVDFAGPSLLAGIETWAVPAATLGLPGLLVMLFVALQATGALAWMPAVRRLRGDDEEGAA